jgi:hypothetical protein
MPVLGVAVAPDPALAEPDEAEPGPEQERRRRGGLLAVLIVVIVLVLAALITGGVLLTAPHGTPAVTAPPANHSAAPSTAPASPTPKPTPTPTPTSPSPTPSPTSTATASAGPSASATTSAAPTGTPTSGELAGAIRTYFGLLPGNTDAAWNRLTPSFQQGHAQGRAYFDSFWGDYSSVTATDVAGTTPDQASATVTYVAKDGTRTVERDTFRLVRQGGVLKIDAESTG